MKNFRNLFKLAGIVLGLFGFAFMSSSCSKEKDCTCISSDSYTYDGVTYTYKDTSIVTTSGKCEDLGVKYKNDDGTYEKLNMDCEEK
jgi:cytochrome c biogenesis factor